MLSVFGYNDWRKTSDADTCSFGLFLFLATPKTGTCRNYALCHTNYSHLWLFKNGMKYICFAFILHFKISIQKAGISSHRPYYVNNFERMFIKRNETFPLMKIIFNCLWNVNHLCVIDAVRVFFFGLVKYVAVLKWN